MCRSIWKACCYERLVYASLAAAIVFEVIGTTFLQKSEQFSRLVPTAAMVLFYVMSFYLLSHALKTLPLGIAYAMWSGLGIVLTTAVGSWCSSNRWTSLRWPASG